MMKVLLVLSFLMASFLVRADETPRHMVIVSSAGLGALGSYEKFRPQNSSFFDDFSILEGNIAFNYAYTLTSRLQLGAFITNVREARKYDTNDGRNGYVDYETLLFGIMAILNFNDDLTNSYYSGLSYSRLNHEEEFKHDGVFEYLEDDRSAEIAELFFGKRFTLKKWGLDNVSYSPNISVFLANSHKDYEDDKIDKSWGVAIQAIKFDVLF